MEEKNADFGTWKDNHKKSPFRVLGKEIFYKVIILP